MSNIPGNYDKQSPQGVIGKNTKGDTPQKSSSLNKYIRVRFEKFWCLYPQRVDKVAAIEEFKKLNPDDALFEQILSAIQAQIQHREELTDMGEWVPLWKNPANWLANQRWTDELLPVQTKEQQHAKNQQHSSRKSAADILSESCQDADFDFNFEDKRPQETERDKNVITFNQIRNIKETH